MSTAESLDPALFSRLVDNLYVEAMVMADEARSYFDGKGMEDKDRLGMVARLSFTCDALKVTTRLMHVIAWLLTQKAWRRGEISAEALDDPRYRLGQAATSEPSALEAMPACARELVTGSEALYERVRWLQENMRNARVGFASDQLPESFAAIGAGPARDLLARLERSF